MMPPAQGQEEYGSLVPSWLPVVVFELASPCSGVYGGQNISPSALSLIPIRMEHSPTPILN